MNIVPWRIFVSSLVIISIFSDPLRSLVGSRGDGRAVVFPQRLISCF